MTMSSPAGALVAAALLAISTPALAHVAMDPPQAAPNTMSSAASTTGDRLRTQGGRKRIDGLSRRAAPPRRSRATHGRR